MLGKFDPNVMALPDLARRLANIVRLGTVSAVQMDPPRVKVQTGDILTNWLPWAGMRAGEGKKEWSPLDEGEQVVILSPSGDTAQGVVFPGLFFTSEPANGNTTSIDRTTYKDGAVIEYDFQNHVLNATLPGGGVVNVTAPGGINLNGDLNVSGNIVSGGDVQDSTRSMAADRALYNAHTHISAAPGSPTATPLPQE